MEIKNAIIKSATIIKDSQGFLKARIFFTTDDCEYQYENNNLYLRRKSAIGNQISFAGHFIWQIMECAGVTKWEYLKGRAVRIKTDDLVVHGIGHIVNESWFNPQDEWSAMASGE